MVGHGGNFSDGNHMGEIDVTAGDEINLAGSSNTDHSFKQIGHGGRSSLGNFEGSISVYAENNIGLRGGTNTYTYAQIGHGGYQASGDHIATSIDVTSNSGSISLLAATQGGFKR